MSEAKLGDGAVTTAKLRDGAVTGAKVQTATLGTVPSAATLSGYSRRGIVRVVASPSVNSSFEQSQAASPEVPLVSTGPFTVYGKCFEGGSADTTGVILIKTSENGAVFASLSDGLGGLGGLFLDTNSPENQRTLLDESRANNRQYVGGNEATFTAMAPNGTAVQGSVQLGVQHGNPPGSNGVYGNGNVCLFAAEMTTLNG